MWEAIKESLGMFAFLAVELTALFLVVSFLIGVIMEFLPNSKIQSILNGKKGKGYLAAALLGGITPFCSCSTIPMLSGLLKARAGFGPTVTFLFTSPLLNPIILGLFLVSFGLQVTVSYALFALLASVLSGFLLDRMGFDRFIKPDVIGGKQQSCSQVDSRNCSESDTAIQSSTVAQCGSAGDTDESISVTTCCDGTAVLEEVKAQRWLRIWQESWLQFLNVLPYLLLGVTIGAFIYGFMPVDLIIKYAGPDNPFAIPVAAFIGVPLYIRAEVVVPLSVVLAEKGMGLGAIMALIIGSGGASITEVILLKSMFKMPMVIAFLMVIFSMAISAGFLFQLMF